jgi:hypothetical protein
MYFHCGYTLLQPILLLPLLSLILLPPIPHFSKSLNIQSYILSFVSMFYDTTDAL